MSTLPNPYSQKVPDFNVPKVTNEGYGAVSGGILGGGIGFDITEKQARYYSDLLAQGYYVTIVKGTDDEISQAESVLKNKIFKTG